MERLGITIGMAGGTLRDELAVAERAEALGYTDAWTAEVGGVDGFSPLAALAQRTTRMRLGTAIVPVFTRPAALVAMSAAALADLSEGRFALGLGTSSDVIVERWMGGGFERPLTRLAEYVDLVRRLLAGERVDHHGTVEVSGFRLQHVPDHPVPILLAALGPRACRLAGRIGDGVIFFLKTPEDVARSLAAARRAADSAGRDPEALECLIRLPVIAGDDAAAVEALARRTIVSYAVVDVYRRSLTRQGFGAEAQAIAAAWAGGDRAGAAGAVSEAMIDALLLAGDPREWRTRLGAFRDAGATTPVLLPLSAAFEPERSVANAAAVIEALAPAR